MVSRNTMVAGSCQMNVIMMILLWLINLTCSGPTCPNDLLTEVFSCLKNLTQDSNKDSSLIASIDAEDMKKNCRTGAFDDSVQCLRRIYDRCNSPEALEWLHKLARPNRWQAGFDRFCEHVHLYARQKNCLDQQNEQAESCIEKNQKQFKNEPKYSVRNNYGYHIDEDIIRKTCRLFHGITICLSDPIKVSCGREVGAVLADFQGGLTPPVCANYITSSVTFHSSTFIVVAVLSLICAVHQNIFR